MRKLYIALAASSLLTAQTANAQNLLNTLASIVKAKASAAVKSSVPLATVQPTKDQSDETNRIIQKAELTDEVKKDYGLAASLIERIALTSACGVNNSAWNKLNRENLNPGSFSTSLVSAVARNHDQYHDKSTCYDVMRIGEVRKPAGNALSFKIFFISPSSELSSNQSFTLLRQADGSWMIKDIGGVYTS